MAARALILSVCFAVASLVLACGSVPGGAGEDSEVDAPVEVDPAAFSGVRAYRHLEALVAIGPRPLGSRASAQARRYLKHQLKDFGYDVAEVPLLLETGKATHLVGLLPGESTDRFALAAAFDTRRIPGIDFVGANASASGPAAVLELARALSERPRPYTVMILLLDGDALPAAAGGAEFPGSRALAMRFAEDGSFERIRLAVFLQQVGDVDLSISRDLRSHHVYREFFWEAAGVLGRGVYFAPDARLESVDGSHIEFIEQGLPRSVLISDPRFGGSEIPGRHAASDKDTAERCAPHSLEVVGEVTLEALDRIATRLTRIDRFHESPTRSFREETGSDGSAEMTRPAVSGQATGPAD